MSYHFEGLLLGTFHDVASDDHLFQYEIGLMEVKDEVQLTNIAKVAVEDLDEMMDDIQHDQLVVLLLNARYEVQGRIPATL